MVFDVVFILGLYMIGVVTMGGWHWIYNGWSAWKIIFWPYYVVRTIRVERNK